MFGIGMPEMILILAIALIVIGPKKLPDLAKSLGRAMNEFKKATREIKASMDIEDDLKDVKHSFDDLSADIKGQGKPKESGKADAAEPATAAAAPEGGTNQPLTSESATPSETTAPSSASEESTRHE